jgi:serine/threonine-protein kinase
MSSDVNAGEAARQAPSRRGSLIAGRYRIDSMIAAGGMGEVWRATDEVLGRVVSVKFLHAQFAADESFLERMLREARAASAVNHPGVVAVYDFGRIDPGDGLPTSYIVMEHVDGPSLSQILLDGPLSVDRTLTILEQTAAALHAAHQAGVVHRDVKPGNIIIAPSGHVKLTDFGIARSQDTSTITDSGSITGTATYLSPEQASGETATSSSDLYSLGVVIYSCLNGAVPFERDGPVAIALAHLKDPPPPLPEQIPPGVSDLVMSLLEKKPADRPVDAEAVRAQAALLRGKGFNESVPPVPTAPAPALEDTAANPVFAGGSDATQVSDVSGATEVTPAEVEEVEKPERYNRRRFFLLMFGAAVAAIALVAAYLVFGRGGEPVTMPSVVGMTRAEAEATLNDLGIDADVNVKDVPKKKAGLVVGQSEDAGTQVDTGSTVGLTVASGQVSLPVEKLIGSNYQSAKRLLADLGLQSKRVPKPSSAPPGTVVDIGESTSRVDVGSTVNLFVAVPKPKPKPTFTPNPTPKPTKSPVPKPTATKTTPPPDPEPTDTEPPPAP